MIRLLGGGDSSGSARGAIALVVGGDRICALARLDYYERYRNPTTGSLDFEVNELAIPLPTWEGDFYRLEIPNLKVRSILGFLGPIESPHRILPGYYWIHNDQLVVYANNAHPAGQALTIESEIRLTVPTPDFSYRFRVEGIGESAIALVESEGLRYYPAQDESDPQVHEFCIIDGVLEFYASPTCAPRIGAELLLIGTVERSLPPPLRAATFTLNQSFYPEILEYLGKSFRRNLRGWTLTSGEFVWDGQNRSLTAVGI